MLRTIGNADWKCVFLVFQFLPRNSPSLRAGQDPYKLESLTVTALPRPLTKSNDIGSGLSLGGIYCRIHVPMPLCQQLAVCIREQLPLCQQPVGVLRRPRDHLFGWSDPNSLPLSSPKRPWYGTNKRTQLAPCW